MGEGCEIDVAEGTGVEVERTTVSVGVTVIFGAQDTKVTNKSKTVRRVFIFTLSFD